MIPYYPSLLPLSTTSTTVAMTDVEDLRKSIIDLKREIENDRDQVRGQITTHREKITSLEDRLHHTRGHIDELYLRSQTAMRRGRFAVIGAVVLPFIIYKVG